MLRILDIYPGSRSNIFPSRIPDPGSKYSRIRIRIRTRIQNFNFNSKKCRKKYDPKYFSQIRDLIFHPSRIHGSTRHRIPNPDPQYCIKEKNTGCRENRNESWESQSRQRTVVRIGSPHPLTRWRVCPPPPFGSGEGTHSLAEEGVGGGPNSD